MTVKDWRRLQSLWLMVRSRWADALRAADTAAVRSGGTVGQ
jgi:hypothetical protein